MQAAREGRTAFYRVDLGRAAELVRVLVADCCRGRPELCEPIAARHLAQITRKDHAMAGRPFNVLFVCTGNSARSIMAEAILNREGAGRFHAHSADTRPAAAPNPLALSPLAGLGCDTTGLRSKDLTEFERPDAPRMDFVFTLCDRATNEECSLWPGQPLTAHRDLPDPARATGSQAEKGLAFREAYRTLRHRLSAFAALPFAKLDRLSLQRLDELWRANPGMAREGR